jgi:NAD(P)-dependent dehydrogenase (short-subunit alcohol dehydrogenase family)
MVSVMNAQKKVAVITGASQGIGAALVTAYRSAGYRVVANSRSIGPNADCGVLTVAGDIADPQVAKQVIAEGFERFGRIDALVNNAGVFNAAPFTSFSSEDWAKTLHVNLAGFFYVTQEAIRRMEPQGSGHIVQITTSLVEQANSAVPAALASVTKGGLNAVTKALAIEYARRGVRVNAVSLGIIKTPMHSPDTYDALAALHPLGRMGEISDVVDAILFLENASFVTGEILHVDGGQSAGH